MTTELEEDLRHLGSELHMDRPLDVVLDTGNRRRRRRHRVVAAGVAAAAVVGGLAGTAALLPSSYDPVFPHADAMAWGPQLVDLPSDELAAADRECRRAARPDTMPGRPIGAGSRGDSVLVVYRSGAEWGSCSLSRTGQRQHVTGLSWDHWEPPGSGFSFATMGWRTSRETDGDPDAVLERVAGLGMVADDVARLYVEAAGRRHQATIEGGVAMFWLPDGLTKPELDRATVTAYDADGELIEREFLFVDTEG